MTCRAILFALSLLTLAIPASAAIKLAEGGKSNCIIVVADDAIPAEKTAARELQKYLSEIIGAQPALGSAAASDPVIRIHVGASKQVRALLPHVNFDTLATDSIIIKTVGDDLILAGSRPRGSLYAVYTFLEDTCGVRFWTSDETDLPKNTNLQVEPLNIAYTPKLRYREVFNEDVMHGKHHEFAARMKLNGHHNAIPPDFGGHYTLIGWCHTAFNFLPPEKFFSNHPEWYAMLDGKRSTAGQLCLTNEEMRQEMTRVVLKRIEKQPDAGMISVSQNDGFGPCQCDKCQAVMKEEGSEAGNVIRFVNAVAAEVKKQHPDFLVETLAYVYSRTPPKKVKPADNVLVRLCSIECDFSHPLAAPSNTAFANDLKSWSAISRNMFIWNYVTNFSNYLIPQPNIRPFAQDLRLFAQNNVVGVFQQGDAYNQRAGDMLPLRTWLQAHLLWNPDQDQRKLIETFMNGYFGAAGQPLLEYVDLVNSLADQPGFTHGCYGADVKYLPKEMIAKFDGFFDRASKAVANDPKLSQRVRREKLVLDHLHLLRYPFKQKLAEAKQQGKPAQSVRDDYQRQVKAYAEAAKKLGVQLYNEGQDFNTYITTLIGRADRATR